jgi:hypothetical protein
VKRWRKQWFRQGGEIVIEILVIRDLSKMGGLSGGAEGSKK